jgi:hypothetical protein
MDIPEVIFKFIYNYVGSSQFPTDIYYMKRKYPTRLHSLPKNTVISHPQALEETESQEINEQHQSNQPQDSKILEQ